MDGIKLTMWKDRFNENVKQLLIEYNSFFLENPMQNCFEIKMDESAEWELIVKEKVPQQIKSRLQQIFLASKPEDSI
jgi:hypothetical protein